MPFFSTYLSTALNSDRECSQHWAVAKQGRRSRRCIGANRCSMFVEPQMSINGIAFSIVVQLPPPQLHMHSKTEGSCLFALMRGRLRSHFATKKWLALRCSKGFSGLPLQLINPMRGLLRPCLPKGNHVRPCLTKGNHVFSFRPYLTKANKKDESQKPGEDRRDSCRISIKDHHKRCDEQTLHGHPIVSA